MAKEWLRQLLLRTFPPVSRKKAMRIASEKLADDVRDIPMKCYGGKPQETKAEHPAKDRLIVQRGEFGTRVDLNDPLLSKMLDYL